MPHEPSVGLAAEDILPVVPALSHVRRISRDKLTIWPPHEKSTNDPGIGWLRRKSCLTRLFGKWCLTPFLLLAGCQAIDPHNMIGRQMGEATPLPTEFVPSPPPATLGAEARTRAFEFVWATINDHYYDASLNGVDWKAARERYRPIALAARNDDEFWDALDRMTGELRMRTRAWSRPRAWRCACATSR